MWWNEEGVERTRWVYILSQEARREVHGEGAACLHAER